MRASKYKNTKGLLTLAILTIGGLIGSISAQQPNSYPQQPPPSNYPQQPQQQQQQPPYYPPQQLDSLVARVALYPDPLLAQVMAAATYPDQIQAAAQWADQHHYLSGPDLANAINNDQLWFDPSVQSLLPFPSVLGMMASDMRWTTDLGNAFLAQQQEVMDAVQRRRQEARDFGYLRSNSQVVVSGGPYIAIQPYDPGVIYVPYYDPFVVYARPRPGFFIGGGIGWGFHISIGTYFRPWGWGYSRFDWGSHAIFINNAHWERNWNNRAVYVHPYAIHRFAGRPAVVEHHEAIVRSEHERQEERRGHVVEEHHDVHHEVKKEDEHHKH